MPVARRKASEATRGRETRRSVLVPRASCLVPVLVACTLTSAICPATLCASVCNTVEGETVRDKERERGRVGESVVRVRGWKRVRPGVASRREGDANTKKVGPTFCTSARGRSRKMDYPTLSSSRAFLFFLFTLFIPPRAFSMHLFRYHPPYNCHGHFSK